MSYDEILTIVLSRWTIYVLISILLVIIFGYLWNYFIIKELREMNKILHQDLNHIAEVRNLDHTQTSSLSIIL